MLTVGRAANNALSDLPWLACKPESHSAMRARVVFGSIEHGAVTMRAASVTSPAFGGGPATPDLARSRLLGFLRKAFLRKAFLRTGFFLAGRLIHAICTGPPRGKAMMLLSPGSLSASVSSPPCSRATADARLRPSPEPGFERLCSSRTKRSTTRARSASGMPGPLSATVSIMRSPSLSARTTISGAAPFTACELGSVYLMALSTRLASAWLTSSRLARTGAGASASTLSVMPFCSASGS